MTIFCDRNLARRLERAEARANARFVDARAALAPESGACWMEAAGALAMFDGPASPCTQTFGLGIDRLPEAAEMDVLEKFFQDRGAAVWHEVSSLAGKGLLPMLNERGYHPIELSTVLFLPLGPFAPSFPAGVTVRSCRAEDRETWVQVSLEGWRDYGAPPDVLSGLLRATALRESSALFLAEIGGHPVAAGALYVHEGVALLAGAATMPEWRNRGAQRALLAARLAYASAGGCDLAMMCAEPGTASQRNAERSGFRVAYTRTKWMLG